VADAHLLDATPESTASGAPAQAPIPPDALIIVPVRDIVLFPGTVLPATLGRPSKPCATSVRSACSCSAAPIWTTPRPSTCTAWGP
jgi:hypothetical protein